MNRDSHTTNCGYFIARTRYEPSHARNIPFRCSDGPHSSWFILNFLWLCSSGLGGLPRVIQLLGRGRSRDSYHFAPSLCDGKTSTTRNTDVKRQCGFLRSPYRPLTVTYPTISPTRNRGANLSARHRQEIAGFLCSRSGSRRIDPSINGGRSCAMAAARPNADPTSGWYELMKNRLVGCVSLIDRDYRLRILSRLHPRAEGAA